MLFGAEPTRVEASVVRDPASGVDIVTSAASSSSGDGVATFTCSTRAEDDQRVHVYGTEGRISIEIPFNIPPDRPTHVFVTAGGDPPVDPATERLTFDAADPYAVEAARFAAADPRRHADAGPAGRRRRQPAGHRAALRRRCPCGGPPGLDSGTRRSSPWQSRSRQIIATVVAIVAVVGVTSFAVVVRPWESKPACAATAATEHPEWSVARRWDEALLDAIRRALPNPPVHARNLYHLSAAMWDAWATYDPTADGVLRHGEAQRLERGRGPRRGDQLRRLPGPDRSVHQGGRRRGVAVRVRRRHGLAVLPAGRRPRPKATRPAAIGNRIAKTILDAGLEDGSNQANGYAAPDYTPVNPPLVVAESGHDA